ncbi:WD40 repeat domain-containing protein [Pseudoalteromonas sp. S16_S37]|uniref:WD40 repeat domain-containing protein n=1 Tax=Pseudoalteromonas sp. S16_S37 TaxID=2720228 RepID=UPI001681287A|nr:hypothetical protein [Pseudoalteromonas sp. S16_S37]MBD1583754.1 hypothetical protein [Pseudoalteromonas sp. S16_S37]
MRQHVVFTILFLLLLSGCSKDLAISEGVVHQFEVEPLLVGQISDDGRLLLTVTASEQVKVWRTAAKQIEYQVPQNELLKPVRHALLSRDNTLLIMANYDTLGVWSVSGKAFVHKVQFSGVDPMAAISHIALSPNNGRVLVAMTDGSVNMADLNTRLNNRFKPHDRPIDFLSFGNQGELFLTGAQDGKVGLWQFGSPKALFEKEFAHRVTSLSVNQDFSRFFVSDGLNAQHIKTLTRGEEVTKLNYTARFKVFRKSQFIPTAELLATSSSKSHLSLWNTQTGDELGTWTIKTQREGATIVSMHTTQTGKLYTLNSDAMLESWDLNALKTL